MTENQKKCLSFLLTRIASWTENRYDQHLRYEFGDEITNEFVDWIKYNEIIK